MVIIHHYSVLYKRNFASLRFSGHDLLDGFEHQLDIGEKAEVFGIGEVVFHFFGQNVTDIHPVGVLGGGQQLFLVLIHDRSQACDAGRQQQRGVVFVLVLLDIARHLGAKICRWASRGCQRRW